MAGGLSVGVVGATGAAGSTTFMASSTPNLLVPVLGP